MNRRRRIKKASPARAKSIQAAWKKSNAKRKGGLVRRTVQANRRAIKAIKKATETKMLETVEATVANRYGGQFLNSTQVDNLGENTTPLPLVMRPLRGMIRGDTSQQRTGDHVILKSLTYRVEFTATAGLLADTHNQVGMLVVLDKHPGDQSNAPNLRGAVGTGAQNDGTLLDGEGVQPYQLFQYLETNGLKNRYKVLKQHKFKIQPVAATSVHSPQANITNTIKLNYHIQYDDNPANTAATAGVPVNQEILFFFYSSSAAAPHPAVSVFCRYRYKDQ